MKAKEELLEIHRVALTPTQEHPIKEGDGCTLKYVKNMALSNQLLKAENDRMRKVVEAAAEYITSASHLMSDVASLEKSMQLKNSLLTAVTKYKEGRG